MTAAEKQTRFKDSFTFKTEYLHGKELLLQSDWQGSELFQIQDDIDPAPKEYLNKLLQCREKQGSKKAQCMLGADCNQQIKDYMMCSQLNQKSKYMCKGAYRNWMDCVNSEIARVNEMAYV